MLKLLADENIPKRLVTLLRKRGVDIVRLQELGIRGIGDKELVSLANEAERTILTRDSDLTLPNLLSIAKYGTIYISYQPSRDDIPKLAEKIAFIARELEPGPRLLVIIGRDYIEVYE